MNNNLTPRDRFLWEIHQPSGNIDLAKAALYVAQEEYPELQIQKYLDLLDTMADQVREYLPSTLYPLQMIKGINKYLFEQSGFTGNQEDYYNPSNSYLHEVLDKRIGIPLTLALVYLEIARRLDFPMVGIGMPGHFLIRPEFEDAAIFVDAFNKGEILFPEDCQKRLEEIYQQNVPLQPEFLAPVSKAQILVRMLTNLKYIYIRSEQLSKALACVDRILVLLPDRYRELRDRGIIYYHLGQFQQSIIDLELYIQEMPNAEDTPTIRHLLQRMKK